MSIIINDVSTQDPVVIGVGITQPSLYYSITNSIDGSVVDMEGATVVFYMRPLTSRMPTISFAAVPLAPPDNDGHNVRYDWQAGDTVVEGHYRGWFAYIVAGQTEPADTEEFDVVVTDQGPGFGTQTGAVLDGLAMWMPTTLSAMRSDDNFGDRWLQAHADYVKQVVMGQVVSADQEASYNQFLVQYLAKRTCVRVIPAAKDYWSRQYRQVLTQGPSESATYPDMIQSLEALRLRLEQELPGDWRQLQMIVPGLPQLQIEPMPKSSLGDPQVDWFADPVTRDPRQTRPASTGGPRVSPWFGL